MAPSARLAPRAGPGPRQSQCSARAEGGRAWDRATAEHGSSWRQQEGRGRARAQPALRRGRAWDRATAEHDSNWRQQDVTMAAASLGRRCAALRCR
eukprot:gene14277-biopygen2058